MRITEEEKAELSKYVHKYIYNIYIAGGVFHCERFPIVYANLKYFYYKRSEDMLDCLTFSKVNKAYSLSDLKLVSNTNAYFNRYYLNVSEFSKEEADEFVQKYDINKSLEQAEMELRLAEQRYLDKKSKYEKLLAAKNEVKDVKVTITPEFGCVFDE